MAMLTPNKIKGYQFQQAGRGTYKSEEVDDFLGQVVDSYEQVFKENGELVKKLNILATKLNEYRKEEGNISKALVNAQSFIDKMIDEANKESKKIVAEAEARAKNVDAITNAKIKVMVDEVEGRMRIAYDKAMAQAKSAKEDAYRESEILILEAKEKAEKTVDDARAVASVIISDATKEAEKESTFLKNEIEREKSVLDNLKMTSAQFKNELVVLYERQIKSVEQIPDYRLDSELEEKVKKIVNERMQEEANEPDEAAVERIVDTFVASDDDLFDADELIKEYAIKDPAETSALDFDFNFDDEKETTDDVDDFFSFDADEDEVDETDEIETAIEEETDEEIAVKEDETDEEIEENFDFNFAEDEEESDEYEDVFSDYGSEDSFRFTAEDLEPEAVEPEEEPVFEFKTEDVDIFSEDAAKDDIPISRPERHRKFDVAFSDEDEVKIEKDESLFLSQSEAVEEDEEEGFSFFDDIDFEDETFEMESDEESFDADDIFGKSDDNEDDDSEGFSFLKNIFGKK